MGLVLPGELPSNGGRSDVIAGCHYHLVPAGVSVVLPVEFKLDLTPVYTHIFYKLQ